MLFGPGISLRFSGCKYILPPLSISTSTSLCLCACARQTSRAQCSELIKGFISLPGSSGTAIWTLFIHKRCPGNNVYFYYHLGGVWVWGGGVLSMSALIAFHEIMPLQECLEETAIFQTTFLQPAVKRQLPSSLALSPSGGTRSCYESRVRSSLTVHVN